MTSLRPSIPACSSFKAHRLSATVPTGEEGLGLGAQGLRAVGMGLRWQK